NELVFEERGLKTCEYWNIAHGKKYDIYTNNNYSTFVVNLGKNRLQCYMQLKNSMGFEIDP
ncbi:15272_t:CDS:2, partial [Racocetra fulgida]